MSYWQNLKEALKRLTNNPTFQSAASSPIPKIVGINTVLFLLWRIKGVPETFLVKHFTFDRFNIREHRYYTMFTYAFSHFSFFSYLFNMLIIASFGRGLSQQFGSRIIWLLYGAGALAGGLSMLLGMPQIPLVVPQVGADSAVTAMITFYGMFNLHSQVLLFFFPVRMWVLLGLMGMYCLFEPSKKNIGGMMAGLLIYQLFRIKMI